MLKTKSEKCQGIDHSVIEVFFACLVHILFAFFAVFVLLLHLMKNPGVGIQGEEHLVEPALVVNAWQMMDGDHLVERCQHEIHEYIAESI